MKNILLVFVFAAFIVNASCQTPEISTLTKEDYLRKSKKQKVAAWVSLGAGIGMFIGGIAINLNGDWVEANKNKGLWLSYIGGATTLVSIPFFIFAHKNKKRAASVAINNQNFLLPQQSEWYLKMYPAVALKVNF